MAIVLSLVQAPSTAYTKLAACMEYNSKVSFAFRDFCLLSSLSIVGCMPQNGNILTARAWIFEEMCDCAWLQVVGAALDLFGVPAEMRAGVAKSAETPVTVG